MLPDFQSQNMASMLKDNYSCTTHEEEKHNNKEIVADIGEDICVDSRSCSPNQFTNGHHSDIDDIATVTPPTSNGLDTVNMDEYTAAYARHRLAILRGEPVSPETSKLLRGMLQDKEKLLQDKMLAMHKSGISRSDNNAVINNFVHQVNRENIPDFRNKLIFDGETEYVRARSITPQDISDESDIEARELARMNADDKVGTVDFIDGYQITRVHYIHYICFHI